MMVILTHFKTVNLLKIIRSRITFFLDFFFFLNRMFKIAGPVTGLMALFWVVLLMISTVTYVWRRLLELSSFCTWLCLLSLKQRCKKESNQLRSWPVSSYGTKWLQFCITIQVAGLDSVTQKRDPVTAEEH